jgi:cytochrome c2
MDSFELNKVLGALLGTVFVVFSVSLASDAIFAQHAPETPGFAIEVPETIAGEGAAEEPSGPSALELLATADAAAGEASFRRCTACHTAEEGGANRVGPNLWDIVGRPVASHEGFGYSAGMQAFAEGGTEWDYEHLSGFLVNPRAYVPGTSMSFAGISDPQEEANLIAYLSTLSNDPVPFPEVTPAAADEPAEGEDAAAEGEEPAVDGGEAPADGAAAPAEGETEAAPAEATPATDGTEAAPTPDAGTPAPGTDATDDAPAGETAPAAEPADEAAPAEEEEDASAAPAEETDAAAAPAATENAAAANAGAGSEALALLASADAAAGEAFFRRCMACHTAEEGGANRVGPNLYGIVNRPAASVEGFNYSDAMTAFGEAGNVWDFANLSGYLVDPRGFVPGNRMAFAGITNPQDEANVLAYLNTLSDEPAPLP